MAEHTVGAEQMVMAQLDFSASCSRGLGESKERVAN
jgi:hypothetical protein